MKIHRSQSNRKTKALENDLFKAFSSLKTAEEAQRFLRDLCTPSELQAMADRWQVVAAIKEAKPYRQIYDETGVSVTTVGRVARCLLLGEGGYNLIYERLEKNNNEE
jgi:TrpR-related protein YerC/YecD